MSYPNRIPHECVDALKFYAAVEDITEDDVRGIVAPALSQAFDAFASELFGMCGERDDLTGAGLRAAAVCAQCWAAEMDPVRTERGQG